MYVVETVSWLAAKDVTDVQMVSTVEAMVPDLEKLPGFKYQSLSKSDQGLWVEVYYWDTAENAHRSNDLMGEKESLQNLIALIELSSLKIEVLTPFQESRLLTFN